MVGFGIVRCVLCQSALAHVKKEGSTGVYYSYGEAQHINDSYMFTLNINSQQVTGVSGEWTRVCTTHGALITRSRNSMGQIGTVPTPESDHAKNHVLIIAKEADLKLKYWTNCGGRCTKSIPNNSFQLTFISPHGMLAHFVPKVLSSKLRWQWKITIFWGKAWETSFVWWSSNQHWLSIATV